MAGSKLCKDCHTRVQITIGGTSGPVFSPSITNSSFALIFSLILRTTNWMDVETPSQGGTAIVDNSIFQPAVQRGPM